jgi:hypothetical protein
MIDNGEVNLIDYLLEQNVYLVGIANSIINLTNSDCAVTCTNNISVLNKTIEAVKHNIAQATAKKAIKTAVVTNEETITSLKEENAALKTKLESVMKLINTMQ